MKIDEAQIQKPADELQRNRDGQENKQKQKWPARLRWHPRMVYGNPDDFFMDLLEEELETS